MRKLVHSLLFLTILIAGCGGSSGDEGDIGTARVTTADGLWVGNLIDETEASYTVYGIISPDGEFRLRNYETDLGYVGTITTSGNKGTGSADIYPEPGFVWSDPNQVPSVSISFDFVEKSSINGSFSSDNDNGIFNLDYVSFYERPSSIEFLEGGWGYYQVSTGLSKGINISSEGVLSGSDNNGCNYSGSISLIDPKVNVYRVRTSVTGCEQSTYNGLGYLDYSTGEEGFIVWSSDEKGQIVDMYRRE